MRQLLLAALLLTACQRSAPRNAESWQTLLARGDYWSAEAALNQTRRDAAADEALGHLAVDRDAWNPGAGGPLVRGQALERAGRFAEAEALLRPLLPEPQAALWLCWAAVDQQRTSPLCREAFEHGRTAWRATGPAASLVQQKRFAEAEQMIAPLLGAPPAEQRAVSILYKLRGDAWFAQNRWIDAESAYRAALETQRATLGGSLWISDTLLALARLQIAEGHAATAEASVREAIRVRETLLPETDWRVAYARGMLAVCRRAERQVMPGQSLLRAYQAVARQRGEESAEARDLR